MISDEVFSEFFKIAREAVERLDRTVGAAMREAHRDHGLYSDCPYGVASVIETALVFAVFTALMEHGYPRKNRVEVRYEYPYSQANGSRMDLALLEPQPNGRPTVGACIEAKWWKTADARVHHDVVKMQRLGSGVRTLMLLAWELPNDSQILADWVCSKATEIGLSFEPSWCDSFRAAVWADAPSFRRDGRLWLAMMETVPAP